MSILNEFELVTKSHKEIFITLRDRTITFSRGCAEVLNNAEYVHLFIDRKSFRVLIVPSAEDENSMCFYSAPKPGRQLLIRWASKEKSDLLKLLAGIEECGKGLRFYGEYIHEDNAIVFNMRK